MTTRKKTKTKAAKKAVKKLIPKSKYNEPVITAIDFGCGQVKASPEYFEQNMQIKVTKVIGVDFADVPGVDKVHDLTQFPYPFKDNSIDAIYSSHFIEHLGGTDRWKFVAEVYRILKPEGKVRFIHPYYLSPRATQDVTHKWPPISEQSYIYYIKSWRVGNKLTHGDYAILGEVDFDYNPFLLFADPAFMNKSEEAKQFEMKYYNNVISDMIVDMVKKTGR